MNNVDQGRVFKHLNIGINDLKFRVKIAEEGKLKAIVAIDFGDFVIKGFRVNFSNYKTTDGKQSLWITPPCYQDGGKGWHPIFFSEDKELWRLIENKIAQEYEKSREEYFKKRFDLDNNLKQE